MCEVDHSSMDRPEPRRSNMCERLKTSVQNRSEYTGLKVMSITNNFVSLKNILTKNISSLFPPSINAATEAYNRLGKLDLKMFNFVLQRFGYVGVKQKVMVGLKNGAAKSSMFLEQIDDKLGLRRRLKALNEQHNLSNVTASIIAKVCLGGRDVFSEIREHNLKGAVSITRKFIVEASYGVLGYASLVVEKVAQLSSRGKSNERVKTMEVNDENTRKENSRLVNKSD